MIGLGREEWRLHRIGLCHDRTLEDTGLVQLRYVVLGDLLLRLALRENFRAIVRTGVRTLAVKLRRVVRDREINLQNLAEEISRGSKVTFTLSAWLVRPKLTVSYTASFCVPPA